MPTTDPWGRDREADRLDAQTTAAATRREHAHCGYPFAHSPHPGAHGPCVGTPLPLAPVTVNVPAREVYVQPPNRWLHAILSVATGGLWLIPWAFREYRHARRVRRATGR